MFCKSEANLFLTRTISQLVFLITSYALIVDARSLTLTVARSMSAILNGLPLSSPNFYAILLILAFKLVSTLYSPPPHVEFYLNSFYSLTKKS